LRQGWEFDFSGWFEIRRIKEEIKIPTMSLKTGTRVGTLMSD